MRLSHRGRFHISRSTTTDPRVSMMRKLKLPLAPLPPNRGALVALAIVTLAVFPPGCEPARPAPRFQHAAESRDALVGTLLDALVAHDTAALRALLVTKVEYRDHMWDELPRAPNEPFDFIWGLTVANRAKGLRSALGRYGGTSFEPVSLEFTKEVERYDGFTLHRGARLRVRRLVDGREGELPILDVLVETGDGWKLLDYED